MLHLFFYSEALAAEGFKRGMSLQKKSRSGALSYSDMITVSTQYLNFAYLADSADANSAQPQEGI